MRSNLIPPDSVGIGLRAEHHQAVTADLPRVDWFEVHSENFFGQGGAHHHCLRTIRENFPLSFHGVGLSLGSTDPLNIAHLTRLNELIDEYQPALVSEHLSWSSIDGVFLHDLLPLPMNRESVAHLVGRVEHVQEFLKRQILVENASTYLEFNHSDMTEWDFVNDIAQRSGCKILCDVNNIYVNACNHSFDANDFIEGVSPELVGEIHLAGHTVKHFDEGDIRIDTHDQRVCDEVWELYWLAIQRFRHAPTLIEWDTNLPELSVLVGEADIARGYIGQRNHEVA